MRHTDITEPDWTALITSIKQPDYSFDLNDLARAVMVKFQIDEATAKRLVRRSDQRTTIKPRNLARLFDVADKTSC